MNKQETEFYQNLFPVLTQANWVETGFTAFGDVAWWLTCGEVSHEEISAQLRLGIILAPTHARLFARLDTIKYPRRHFVKWLESKPETIAIAPLLVEATEAAKSLLVDNAEEIRAAIHELEKEITGYRGDRND